MYISAIECGKSFHELALTCRCVLKVLKTFNFYFYFVEIPYLYWKNKYFTYRFGQDQIDEVNNGGPGILARGLYLVGAAWDPEKNVLIEAER